MRNAGAIMSIAGSRLTWSIPNSAFLTRYLRFAIRENLSPGAAMMFTKAGIPNDLGPIADRQHASRYNILGDPFLRKSFPTISSNMTFIPQADSLLKLQTVTVEGSFEYATNITSLQTKVFGSIEDYFTITPRGVRFPRIRVENDQETLLDGIRYITRNNPPIFRGSTSPDTCFSFSFIVPEATNAGNSARILAMGFDENNRTFINKMINVTISEEIDPEVVIDRETEPSIQLFVGCLEFEEGDSVPPNPVLYAIVSDPAGVDTVGADGRNIVVWIPSTRQRINATENFEYKLDSWTEGILRQPLSDLPHGLNRVEVYAYNNMRVMGRAEATFFVEENVPITIQNPLVYPNPMSNGGHFTFILSHDADIIISIYTITGRRIRTLRPDFLDAGREGFNTVFWDGRDADGDRIANNTYFYRIRANTRVGRGQAEVTEAFIMLR
jgi:hypothetical protein